MQLYKQLHSSQLLKSAEVILFQVSCKSMSFHVTFKGHVLPLAPNVFDHFSPRGPQAVIFFFIWQEWSFDLSTPWNSPWTPVFTSQMCMFFPRILYNSIKSKIPMLEILFRPGTFLVCFLHECLQLTGSSAL